VYLLYGSQTGNAESIAEEVSAKFAEEGVPNKCMTLSGAKKQPMKDLASAMLIICSTTGNGDAPENADSWWRSIKLRSAVRTDRVDPSSNPTSTL
jgi:sulfite reductase (NADPH) flavoprotein alpha-component